MRWPTIAAALVGMLVSLVTGCGESQVTVAPGAQLVHLVATETQVRLDVASVRAGDVFVQLDDPPDGGSFTFTKTNPVNKVMFVTQVPGGSFFVEQTDASCTEWTIKLDKV